MRLLLRRVVLVFVLEKTGEARHLLSLFDFKVHHSRQDPAGADEEHKSDHDGQEDRHISPVVGEVVDCALGPSANGAYMTQDSDRYEAHVHVLPNLRTSEPGGHRLGQCSGSPRGDQSREAKRGLGPIRAWPTYRSHGERHREHGSDHLRSLVQWPARRLASVETVVHHFLGRHFGWEYGFLGGDSAFRQQSEPFSRLRDLRLGLTEPANSTPH